VSTRSIASQELTRN